MSAPPSPSTTHVFTTSRCGGGEWARGGVEHKAQSRGQTAPLHPLNDIMWCCPAAIPPARRH